MPQPSITQIDTPQSCCRFALAWADITPPVGIYHRMWGAAKHERATGVHRPLRATVAVFATDSPPAGKRAGQRGSSPEQLEPDQFQPDQFQILLALDHCVLGAMEHEELLAQIAQASGQPKE